MGESLQPMDQQKTCLFCPTVLTSKTRSKEHVMADWILRYYQIQDHIVTPKRLMASNGNSASAERRHPLAALQVRRVCSDCNHGWMSDLEQRAKTILLPLSKCERRIADLSHVEQSTVSHWAAKTALVMHLASGLGRDRIPAATYQTLRCHRRRLPAGIAVFGFQTPDLAEDLLGL